MKILYLLPGTAISGGSKVVIEQVFFLKRIPGIKAFLSAPEDYPIWSEMNIPFIKSQLDALKFEKFDVIITTFFTQLSVLDKLPQGVKHIHFCQGYEGDYVEDLGKYWLRREITKFYSSIKEVITVNRYLKKKLTVLYPHLRINVIGQGLNRKIFYPQGLKRKYILVPGYVDYPFKGVERAMDVALEIKRILPGLKIARVSPVNTFNKEKKMWKIDAYFSALTPFEMSRIYNESVLCVYTPYKEGFGLPFLESLSCGTPVVASRIPPFQEITLGYDYPLFDLEKERHNVLSFCIRLLRDNLFHAKTVRTGLQISRKFNYFKVMMRLLKILAKIDHCPP